MVTSSLTSDIRFKQMTLQVLIDRWVSSSKPVCLSVPFSHTCVSEPFCLSHLTASLYLTVSQVGVPTVLSISDRNLSLPEDSRLSGSQQSPQTLGFMQGNLFHLSLSHLTCLPHITSPLFAAAVLLFAVTMCCTVIALHYNNLLCLTEEGGTRSLHFVWTKTQMMLQMPPLKRNFTPCCGIVHSPF